MARSALHRPALFLAVVALWGCGGAGSGCNGLKPLPGGRFTGPKTDNAVNIRLSKNGVAYLNNNWRTLLDQFAPGQKLEFPVGCSVTPVSVVGDIVFGDQGNACPNPPNGDPERCGVMDGRCCPTANAPGCSAALVDTPQVVTLQVTGFQLIPTPPDSLEATLSVSVATGGILVSTVNRNHVGCVGLSPAKCAIDFNTARETPSNNAMNATVKFSIDQRWDKLLSFAVTSLDGTSICGAQGASPKPSCLDPKDIDISGRNNCGNVYCGLADWDPVKAFLFQKISPMLEAQVKNALAGQSCQPCGPGNSCPSNGAIASSCDVRTSLCMDGATNQCVPRFLGVEGRLSTAAFLESYGVPSSAALDLSIQPGSSVTVDQGLSLGTRAGIAAAQVAECVPSLPAPAPAPVPAPNFEAEATPGSTHHVAIGISQPLLNLAMHHAQQSGTLCLQVSSATVGLMNTGLFKTFLPSLGKLSTRDGKDAPMMMALRPGKPPTVTVGKGTVDPVTKRPLKPLLLLDLDDVGIDFYAMLDDRYVRLFSLTADISLPMSLVFDGCSSMQPALGDLKQLVTHVRTANSEILAEDPKVLADLIPAVIGFAEPAIAGALKPFALPQAGNFKLKVNEAKGVGPIPGTDAYYHLGLYAQLMPSGAACAASAPTTVARVERALIPRAEQMRLRGQPLPWPTAVLQVDALGSNEPAEFAYRVDGGLWTTFLATSDHRLEVSHPSFLLQGVHVIEVRSRLVSEPNGISAPVAVHFVVDWEAPTVQLEADRAANRLWVHAHDVVTDLSRLEYAYRVGTDEPTPFGASREVDLSAIDAAGGLEVLVRDSSGNVGSAIYRVPRVDSRSSTSTVSSSDALGDTAAGCAAVPGRLPMLALVAALVLRRRRAHS